MVQGSGIGMSFPPDRSEGPAAICNTSSKTNATDLQPAYILNVISAPVAACVAYASVVRRVSVLNFLSNSLLFYFFAMCARVW